jgi:hypothetical protein
MSQCALCTVSELEHQGWANAMPSAGGSGGLAFEVVVKHLHHLASTPARTLQGAGSCVTNRTKLSYSARSKSQKER